jgi:hypothetical protein
MTSQIVLLRTVLAAALLLTVAFTCGDRRPVVANDLREPIFVGWVNEDGTVVDFELPASGRLFLSDPPHHPQQVVITVPGGGVHTFTEENAPGLLRGAPTGSVIGWRVTESGVVPLTEGDLELE